MPISARDFRAIVWTFYAQHGRHNLPWRQPTHLKPYTILVSELMLQQTQVARVVPKYKAFIRQFPSARALAVASLGDVLVAWQGLGYNRRAKYLQAAAAAVSAAHRGHFPRSFDQLIALPGVGPYTAAAILNFAYNKSTPLIETNVRTTYLHHFFASETNVSDAEILKLVEHTMDNEQPREWFWALMDYGAYLKETFGNNTSASKHYAKQSKFKGSDREIRGTIIRLLSMKRHTKSSLLAALSFETARVEAQLARLCAEELVVRVDRWYTLPHTS